MTNLSGNKAERGRERGEKKEEKGKEREQRKDEEINELVSARNTSF